MLVFLLMLYAYINVKCIFSTEDRYVVNKPTVIEDVPYHASLHYYGDYYCGALFIKQHALITAAHCCYGLNVGNITIRFGASSWSGGRELRAFKCRINPNYNPKTKHCDLAILTLVTAPDWSSTVKAITPYEGAFPKNEIANVTGFGGVDISPLAHLLFMTQVRILPRRQCKKHYQELNFTRSMFCAVPVQNIRESCFGDSAGALTINGKLVGIISYRVRCNSQAVGGVYLFIPACKKWIYENGYLLKPGS